MRKIKIFDTTLRDGEQSPGYSMNTASKIRLALQLEKLGVDIIEAGFPIASPDDFQAVSEISSAVRYAEICGLARCTERDIRAAYEATRKAKKPRIHTFLATSDVHLKYKLGLTRKQAVKKARESVSFAKNLCKRVDFSPEDAFRSDQKFLAEILTAVIEAGADTLNIPDTVGYSTPEECAARIDYIKKNVKGIEKVDLSVHCHNDLGMAAANSLTAVAHGATEVQCTINGIGERAGNASLEEIVMAIKTRKDFFKNCFTKINTRELYKTSRMLVQITGIDVQPNKAIVGANAFAHEAGIHQDGVLKKRQTYEIMRAQDVGVAENRLVLGKHSGRHAIKTRLASLGYKLNDSQLKIIFRKFKELADKKKEVFDDDLEALVSSEIFEAKQKFKLASLDIKCGTIDKPEAEVSLKLNGSLKKKKCKGTGPVDAAYKAIDKIINGKYELLEFSLNSVTEGIDALAEVIVKIKDKKTNRIAIGRAANTDIVVASALSYLSALNRL